MRRYAINSQHNMRDLGGYVTLNNKQTAWGKIFRSDCPYRYTAQDTEVIEALNIGCVIDLRTSNEARRRPSYFNENASVEYHNVSFKNGNGMPESEESIPTTYFKMMEEEKVIKKLLKIIATSKKNVLFHCAIGKDRTGVVSALILSICHVPKVEIITDYQISETYLHEILSAHKVKNPDLPKWLGRSKPEYMRKCLALLEDKYGSFEGYMKALKIPEDTIHGIRKKLLING